MTGAISFVCSRNVWRKTVATATVLLAISCSGGDTGPTVPEAKVTAIAISPATTTIVGAGQSVPVTAVLTVQNGPITAPAIVWASSDVAIATVTGSGTSATVTSVAPGTATITAKVGTISGTMQTTVASAVQTLTLVRQGTGLGTIVSTPAGLQCTGVNCTGTFATGSTVTLQATAAAGSLLAAWGGACSGSASCALTMDASRSVTVTFDLMPVATVTVGATSTQLTVGQTATAAATLRAADNTVLTGRTVTWSSSNANAVSVSPTGVLTALAPGAVSITALSEGKSGAVTVVSSATQVVLTGNWTGTYTCSAPINNGRLTLSVTGGTSAAPTAQLSFYDSPTVPNFPYGSFAMRGSITGNTVNFDADETDWIFQPPTLTTFDLRGTLSVDGTTYSGTIPQPGCTGFTLKKSTISNGLVAYYPFTGNANDQSGNGFHGTAFGATLTTDRLGVANSAYDFSGIASVTAPIFLPSASISVSAWIRLRSPRCWGGIVDGFREKWEFVLDCISGDRLEFAQWLSNGAFVDHVDAPRMTLGQWYHVAVTIDGTQGRFFVDGLPTTTFTLTAPALTLPSLLAIGHSASGTSQFFDGAMDEIRLYNRALTASEVRELCRTDAAAQHSCKTSP